MDLHELAAMALQANSEMIDEHLGPGYRKFVDSYNKAIPAAAKEIPVEDWHAVCRELGQDFRDDANARIFLYGLGHEASVLLYRNRCGLDIAELETNVGKLCAAIARASLKKL